MELKTCIVTGQYPPQVGGVGHSAYRITNLLASRGMNVHVVAFEKHPKPLPFDESFTSTQEGDVLVHRIKVYYQSRKEEDAPTPTDILTRYNREMFQALEHFHRTYKYDVLHAFFLYPAGFIAGLVGQLNGVKVIDSIRGNDVGKYVFDPVRMPLIRSALENADYVTSVATNLIDLADRSVTPIADRAKTILNSIDLTRLQPQAKPELPLKGIVIGTSGLFRYKKGLYYLFKALQKLEGRFEYTVLLAGDYFKEEDREPHEQYMRDCGISDRVIVTGKIPHGRMADYLQLFDILVYPSLFSEGCPLSMLEAMALKKTIIGSRAGAIPEIIRDRENGLLVNSGSADEISKAILEVVEDEPFRKKLAENASATIGQMTLDKEFSEWLNTYEAVMKK